MSNMVIPKGVDALLGSADITADTIKVALIAATPDSAIKTVTNVTNASPMVVSAASHGVANGSIVVLGGVGGNLAANGTFLAANVTAGTLELQTLDGQNTTGSGAYTSGGYLVNLTLGDTLDDFDAAVVGAAQTLANKTLVNGVFDADDVAFPSVPVGSTVIGILSYKDTGVAASSRTVGWYDGRIRAVCAATASGGATTVAVEPLEGPIASGTALVFSNGVTATLTAPAVAGARTLTVSALGSGIAAGHAADAPTTSNNLPCPTNNGTINVTWPATGIFKVGR